MLLYSENRVILASAVSSQYADDRAVNWRLRSLKVINFCCNRKPMYDFLLANHCHLSSILHRFGDIASRSWKLRLRLTLRQIEGILFELRHKSWQAKSWGTVVHFSENCMILSLTILSQYTCVTDRRHTMTIAEHHNANCNVRLKSSAWNWIIWNCSSNFFSLSAAAETIWNIKLVTKLCW